MWQNWERLTPNVHCLVIAIVKNKLRFDCLRSTTSLQHAILWIDKLIDNHPSNTWTTPTTSCKQFFFWSKLKPVTNILIHKPSIVYPRWIIYLSCTRSGGGVPGHTVGGGDAALAPDYWHWVKPSAQTFHHVSFSMASNCTVICIYCSYICECY